MGLDKTPLLLFPSYTRLILYFFYWLIDFWIWRCQVAVGDLLHLTPKILNINPWANSISLGNRRQSVLGPVRYQYPTNPKVIFVRGLVTSCRIRGFNHYSCLPSTLIYISLHLISYCMSIGMSAGTESLILHSPPGLLCHCRMFDQRVKLLIWRVCRGLLWGGNGLSNLKLLPGAWLASVLLVLFPLSAISVSSYWSMRLFYRKRRIKCDETKPACKRCIKYSHQLTNGYRSSHDYKCPGYSNQPSLRQKPPKSEATSTSERKLVSCERAQDLDGAVSKIVPGLPSNTKLDRRISTLSHNRLGSMNRVSEQCDLPVSSLNPSHNTMQGRGSLLLLEGNPYLPQSQIHNSQNSLAIGQSRNSFTWSIPVIKLSPKVLRERSFSLPSSTSNPSSSRSTNDFSDHSTTTANTSTLDSHRHSSCTLSIEMQIEDSDENLRIHSGDVCSPSTQYTVSDWVEERPAEDSLRERENRMQEIVYRLRNLNFVSSLAGKALHNAPLTSHPQTIIDLGAGSKWWTNKSS